VTRRWLVALLVLTAAPAFALPRTLKLRFPAVSVDAGSRPQLCIFVPVRTTAPLDIESIDLRVLGARAGFGIAHFLVYAYEGDHLADVEAAAGRVSAHPACLGFGPADLDDRQQIAIGLSLRVHRALPPGTALRLAPSPRVPGGAPAGVGFLLDVNWINPTNRARVGSASVVLRRAPRNRTTHLITPFAATSAELGLFVPPSARGSTETSTPMLNAERPGVPPVRDAWGPGVGGGPPGDVCVFAVSGRMHERGKFLGVDAVDATGASLASGDAVPDPFEPGRRHFFGAFDFTDPGLRFFQPPLLLRAGQSLSYECWTDNGVTIGTRFGCEERAGETPGVAEGLPGGGPAKPCTGIQGALECPPLDPSYPGRTFTGACVPANAVAGPSPRDEACALTGLYFDAVPGAAAGSECDVAR